MWAACRAGALPGQDAIAVGTARLAVHGCTLYLCALRDLPPLDIDGDVLVVHSDLAAALAALGASDPAGWGPSVRRVVVPVGRWVGLQVVSGVGEVEALVSQGEVGHD